MPERASKQRKFPTAEQIADLTEAVLALNEQVRCLRLSVDEIEQELGWAIRTKVLDRLPPPEFPCDARLWPNTPEEAREQIEHVCDSEDLPVDESPALPAKLPAVPRRQSNLW